MRIDIISLFPELIESFYEHSIIGRARKAGLLDLDVTNPRNFTFDKHHMVDDTIYGGGCGMLMKAQHYIQLSKSYAVPYRRVGSSSWALLGRPLHKQKHENWPNTTSSFSCAAIMKE